MNRDHEPSADPFAPASELPAPETPPTITPPELEQVIERVSARHIADLQALKEQLRQPLPDSAGERLEAHPGKLGQQDILPAQTEKESIDLLDLEIRASPQVASPTPQADPAQQRQFAQASAHYVQTQAQHPRLAWSERLRQNGWSLNSLYWAVIWVVAMLIGLVLGALVAIITAAG